MLFFPPHDSRVGRDVRVGVCLGGYSKPRERSEGSSDEEKQQEIGLFLRGPAARKTRVCKGNGRGRGLLTATATGVGGGVAGGVVFLLDPQTSGPLCRLRFSSLTGLILRAPQFVRRAGGASTLGAIVVALVCSREHEVPTSGCPTVVMCVRMQKRCRGRRG